MRCKHAIVLGGGFAGTLTASMLSNYFKHVTLVERDKLHANAPRKGLPQASHLHGLIKNGQDLLETLMPGILAELRNENAPIIDWANDTRWYGPFGRYPQYPSDIKTLSFSRSLLDRLMYERVRKIKNVSIVTGKVNRLIIHADNVNAVQVNENIIQGDLIIDARGRGANTGRMLQQYHFPVLKPNIVKNNLSYASRVYKLSSSIQKDFKQIYLQAHPFKRTSGVVIAPIENQKVIVTALTMGENQLSRDETAFQNYLTTIPNGDVIDYVRQLSSISTVHIFKHLYNIHNRFGSMKKWPNRFIVIGDAVCVLNPVYGQGMTLVVKQILLLKSLFDQHAFAKPSWEQHFQKKVDALVFLPWLMATAEDRRAMPTESSPFYLRFLHTYFDKVLSLAVKNVSTHTTFIKVLHMLKSPYHLFHPKMIFKILFYRSG